MANNINTNYSMYQKTMGHIGGKREAGRKKGVEGEDKEKKPFGEDFGVQLSDAGLAALELQRKQKAERRASFPRTSSPTKRRTSLRSFARNTATSTISSR